jgi:Zn ribbon nucleic-acid-binding protein
MNQSIKTDIIDLGEIELGAGKTFTVDYTVESPKAPISDSSDSKEPIEFNIDWNPLQKYEKTTVSKRPFRSLRCPQCNGQIYVVEYDDDESALVKCSECGEFYHATLKSGHALRIGRFIIGTGNIFTSLTWDEPTLGTHKEAFTEKEK